MRIGLIDLSFDNPSVNLFEKAKGIHKESKKKGEEYIIKETVPIEIDSEHKISIEKLPKNIDKFYLSLPLDLLNFRIIKMPFPDKEKILFTLPYELKDITIKPIERNH